jgi:hypothetical protein
MSNLQYIANRPSFPAGRISLRLRLLPQHPWLPNRPP